MSRQLFEIQKDLKMPNKNKDFADNFWPVMKHIFEKIQIGESVVLPFHYCNIYPLVIKHFPLLKFKSRQVAVNAWGYWRIR